MKKRVFIDMDGVIVDFDGYAKSEGITPRQIKEEGWRFLLMQPLQVGGRFATAVDVVKAMVAADVHDIWIATKPPTGSSDAVAAKVTWVNHHLPELKRKLIITPDKGLLGDRFDYLIDDRPHKGNCEAFKGTLIKFPAEGYPQPGAYWYQVLSDLGYLLVETDHG